MSVGWSGKDRKQGEPRPPVRNTKSQPGEQPGGQSNPENRKTKEAS
jgi:hypothetical protein